MLAHSIKLETDSPQAYSSCLMFCVHNKLMVFVADPRKWVEAISFHAWLKRPRVYGKNTCMDVYVLSLSQAADYKLALS